MYNMGSGTSPWANYYGTGYNPGTTGISGSNMSWKTFNIDRVTCSNCNGELIAGQFIAVDGVKNLCRKCYDEQLLYKSEW